jgi:hypothetical protein
MNSLQKKSELYLIPIEAPNLYKESTSMLLKIVCVYRLRYRIAGNTGLAVHKKLHTVTYK